MKYLIPGAVCLLFCATSSLAEETGPWSFELRGNSAVATQDLGDSELNPGFGLETTAAYYFLPHLGVYAGWGWQHFSADGTSRSRELDFEETGYRFGLQFKHPIGETGLQYLLSAGGIYSHIEVEDEDGDIDADSGHGFGAELGLGLVIPMKEHWSIVPSVRYHYLSRSMEVDGENIDLDLSYFSYGASLNYSF